jgi:alpha-amylase
MLPSLTRGDMELLEEKDGMAVYKRTYKDETAVIAINNSTQSQKVVLDSSQVEEGKELRGMLADDLVRSEDGKYNLIIDREQAEVYILAEKSGLNIPLIAALAAVYTAFMIFIFLLWKRSKKKRAE